MKNDKTAGRLPPWFRVPLGSGDRYRLVRSVLARENLHTVCSSARCPNAGECWSAGTATFMILGDVCTRYCGFCAVKHGKPDVLQPGEPDRIVSAVETLGLRYVVVTSVTRDDLEDGGASVFSDVIRALKSREGIRVEVLIPDFSGNQDALQMVLQAGPDILNHNMETVRELYSVARPQADYQRSLTLLHRASTVLGEHRVKSGVMVGLGESRSQLSVLFKDLRAAGVGRLTVGQYLQPSKDQLPIDRFPDPAEFADIRTEALELGFRAVASGPLVRSSYHAADEASQ